MRSETEIIERIWRALPRRTRDPNGAWLRMGTGDDAAVIGAVSRGGEKASDWVLSTDAFLEGVHFLPKVHSPADIGYKAIARAASDLAAMGAAPRFFLLSIALPVGRTGSWLDGFLKGMAQAAHEFGMALIGGDTSQFHSIVMNVTVGGSAGTNGVMTRAGARPGDMIYVSGKLGAAQLGLELIRHGMDGKATTPRIPVGAQWKRLLQPHLRPRVQIDLGRWLAGKNPSRHQIASAAIDTSDSLSTDLNHLCEASGVGARVWAGKIPSVWIPKTIQQRGTRLAPLELTLHGGEDYQLLFTVPSKAARHIPPRLNGVLLTQIGMIIRLSANNLEGASRVELVAADGRVGPLQPKGWDPFIRRSRR